MFASTQRWYQYLKSYLMEDEGPFILYTQNHDHWLFGDAKSLQTMWYWDSTILF